MAGNETPSRPTRVRPGYVAVVAIVVLALGVTLIAQPWNRTGQTADASPSPGASTVAGSPGASPDTWADIDLQPLAAVATLEPSSRDVAGVAPDTTFALTSLTGDTAIALAKRIEVSPPAELAIRSGADTTQVTLAPESALKPGTLYRFALRGPEGSLAASWAFRVRSPLHVIGMLPGDRNTNVPVATGIEFTFDQEGAADIADWFSISPAVEGTFERHGRTQVFVPDQLKWKTLYTVTLKAGLPREGTDLALETDVVMRFETEGKESTEAYLKMGRDAVESSPSEAPVLGVEAVRPWIEGSDERPPAPKTADVRVYRVPSLGLATSLFTDFLAAPRWTQHSYPLMPTDGLPLMGTFTATVEPLTDDNGFIRFPERLEEGWYVVEIQGTRRSQAFLQVTSVSAWVSVLTDRTVVWVNDVSTTKPIEGATVAVAGGQTFGTADGDGLVVAETPPVLLPEAEAGDYDVPEDPPLLVVRSPADDLVLVPFEVGWNGGIYRGEWWEKSESADATFWSSLLTDRTLYRQTDTISAWGYLRGRDDDKVPTSVLLRLVSNDSSVSDPPAVSRTTATPDASGAYTASLSLAHVPYGYYNLEAVVGGRVINRQWINVDVIRKPVYRLAVTSDRTAVITGSNVAWTTTATFFDGSPVPSLDLTMGDMPVATDTAGRATLTLKARSQAEWDVDGRQWDVHAMPSEGEEGEISASAHVLVFPSSWHLDADAKVEGTRLKGSGDIAKIDLEKVEAKLAADAWDGDPDGTPVGGATVRIAVVELVPVRTLVGRYYDFIEKVVRSQYRWDTERRDVKSFSVRTGSNGRFSFDVAIPDPEHQYEIKLQATDPKERVGHRTILAGKGLDVWQLEAGIEFQNVAGENVYDVQYGIGETIEWRIAEGGTPIADDDSDRYLYVVAQRGLRAATVTGSPTFERTFAAADAPGIFIMGVRFTGSTYAPKAASWADFDESERAIDVKVTTDRERYRPGEDVKFTVTTTDARGRPIAADVVLQAVDEKLYAMGGAYVADPLEMLYRRVDSGIVRLTATHQVPTRAGAEGEGGDTMGGDGRDDFRDTLAFLALRTGADGRATTTVKLSDDLTSWHVAASAVTADLQAGVAELLVPVGLPLFVDATIADEFLLSDQPIIRLRAYGEGLRPGDPVEFTVSSTTLGLAATKVSGTAFTALAFDLPDLRLGTQKLDIAVVAPTRTDADGKPLADRLIRSFGVVRSRSTSARTEYLVLGDALPSAGGDEAAIYTFSDAGRGRFVPILVALTDPPGGRLDRGLAQAIAHDLLVEEFGRDPATLPPMTFDPTRYTLRVEEDESGVVRGGIALLPYGGLDPWLAARVALMAPDKVQQSELQNVLASLQHLDTTQRDLWLACTAGLASLGAPVLSELNLAKAESDLTVTEQLYLGLGYAALGDDASALAIERSLLEEHGQALGQWVRLHVGPTGSDDAEATALMAVLAAGLGDPLAPSMIDYVVAHPSVETTHALDVAAATKRALERTPSSAAAFAYTVDGQRSVVRLDPGEAVTLALTPTQRASLRLERVSGKVGLAIAWRDAVDASALATDPLLTLARQSPTSVPGDQLVTVNLKVTFDPDALKGCYEVVEEVPSGLAPVDGYGYETGIIYPSSIVGQRVTFCVSKPGAKGALNNRLRYVARVIDTGTYTWEPAVMQLEGVAERVAVTGSSTVRIGD